MNGPHRKPPIRYSVIGTPLTRIQSPMLPSQKSCQRSAKLIASTALFVIFPIAPTNSRFEESVDVSVQYRSRVTDLVLGAQVLNHLVGVQHVSAHLVAPRAATIALQRVQL